MMCRKISFGRENIGVSLLGWFRDGELTCSSIIAMLKLGICL